MIKIIQLSLRMSWSLNLSIEPQSNCIVDKTKLQAKADM